MLCVELYMSYLGTFEEIQGEKKEIFKWRVLVDFQTKQKLCVSQQEPYVVSVEFQIHPSFPNPVRGNRYHNSSTL